MTNPLATATCLPSWQQELAEAISSPADLLARLGLDPSLLPGALTAAQLFRLRVPASFLARMRPGDPNDPLLRQVLPVSEEGLKAALARPRSEVIAEVTASKLRGRGGAGFPTGV